MLKQIKNPCNLYILLWVIYQLQGTLYPEGTIVSQILLMVLLVTSLQKVLKLVVKNGSPIYFYGLNSLLLMFSLYGLLLFFTDGFVVHGVGGRDVLSINYIKSIYISLLPIYVFYIYTKENCLTLKLLQCWMPILLIVAIADYYQLEKEVLLKLIAKGSSREEITNNASYVLLSILPGMYVFKNKRLLYYLGICICIVYVFLGMKRGAIIISIVVLSIVFLHSISEVSGFKKFFTFIIVSCGIIGLISFVDNLLTNSEYFNYQLQKTLEGNSSHREELYGNFINAFLYDASFFQMLLGRGACGTIKYSFNYAHNDWLEILTNQGIIGVSIFGFYWLLFIKMLKCHYLSSDSRFCLLLLFVIYFMKALFSMSISSMAIYATLMMGFSLADGFVTQKERINE